MTARVLHDFTQPLSPILFAPVERERRILVKEVQRRAAAMPWVRKYPADDPTDNWRGWSPR